MANLSKGFKRFMAIGCSHGSLVDPKAVETVMRFKDKWNPHTRVHLGDICDYAAFRNGAHGTKDEAEAIGPDIQAGIRLIHQYEPTDVLIGNHDVRVFKQSSHQNAIIALAASHARNEFLMACDKVKVRRLIDHYDIARSWVTLGDTKLMHGWFFNEMAMRDHAEHFGKCIIAHLHVAGMMNGRRSDNPTCHCVGTLASVERMDYANTRRATARWSHGFAYGEYNDRECHTWLSSAPQGQAGAWRLPL